MDAATRPFWISAFIDCALKATDAAARFWSGVTGFAPTPTAGVNDEYLALVPHDGAYYVSVEAEPGPNRIHLDVHVPDARAAADAAVELGAAEVAAQPAWIVLRSPVGLQFCFVQHARSGVTKPVRWPGGQATIVDQVSLDIPAESFDRECDFWAAITHRPIGRSRWFAEFRNLERPVEQPLRLLVQRIGSGSPGAHFDVATNDRALEIERHLALGAAIEKVNDRWAVLRDPIGLRYCIIDRAQECC